MHVRFEKEGHPFPYNLKGALDKEKKEHNISHAIHEAAKAVVEAIEQEVDILYSKTPKHEKQIISKATRSARKTSRPGLNKNGVRNEEHAYHSLEEFLEFTDDE